MIICSIGSKNFRTLVDFELQVPSDYCAISGKNNAGKSAILRIIQHFLFDKESDSFFNSYGSDISYTKDFTQWKSSDDMEVSIKIIINSEYDSEVFFVVKTFSSIDDSVDNIEITLSQIYKSDGTNILKCMVEDIELEGHKASEILKKLRSASNIVVHNSTNPERNIFYAGGGSFTEIIEAHFSPEDQKKISEAQKGLQTRVKKAAKQHKEDLEGLLGKLKDKFQVELSTIDRQRNSRFPLEVKLTDKSVEVPLNDWGAGTQNRTRIMMSVLEAARIRSSSTPEDRSTPVFLVEEPESFLHPSAQAEFGQVLNSLSKELNIQIIATTHSPYMLNQTSPSSNILLERKINRNLLKETYIQDTSGDDWMMPFSEILGIVPKEFSSWKNIFSSVNNMVILVEGEIDKEYFLTIKEKYPNIYQIDKEVEIIPYGGKDALKNTPILQFMINKFGSVFITYDQDAQNEVKPSLERIGLVENENFISIGLDTPGNGCIEGLLPPTIKRKVYSEEIDLVTQLTGDTKSRNSAKSSLKRKMLDEFKKSSFEDRELSAFRKIFTLINKNMKK